MHPFIRHLEIFYSSIREEKGQKFEGTPITSGLFKNILQKEKGSSYLHELHLPPIVCLLTLTFTGPSWSLLPIPIHFESIDRHWKHSCGFDFSTSLSFLSNHEILVHCEKCTYTYTVKYFMYIHTCILDGCRQVICEHHWWSLQENVHMANTLVQIELIKYLASNTKRIIQDTH